MSTRTLWIGASGMAAQQRNTENIANNMANVNTSGYKAGNIQFQDMLYETVKAAGATTGGGDGPVGIQLGTGVRVASVSKTFTQGNLRQTSSDLDLAIEGDGFFEVTLPDGSAAYTRNGNFHRNADGQIVTVEGYEVANFPNIDINASSINILPDGTVTSFVKVAGQPAQNIVNGQIQISRFPNPEGLHYMGRNVYGETEISGAPTPGTPGNSSFGAIAQRSLEDSNVDIVTEMVDMISAQRAYELNSKSIKTADSMMQQVAGLKN